MTTRRRGVRPDHPIIVTFLILAVIGFMWFAADVLKPLALAVLLSFALLPLSRFFERLGSPRPLAVVLTILIALTVLGAIGYKVGEQLTELSSQIERYRDNLHKKFTTVQPRLKSIVDRASHLGDELTRVVEGGGEHATALPVQEVSTRNVSRWLQGAAGPYLEGLGAASFVLILVLFILMTREDLNDRIVRLFGLGRVSLTTKTMDEVGQRISRYLTLYAVVNSTIGAVIAVGLYAIGVPLAVLWGVLVALFRFIPYVGPGFAFLLPLVFSIANFPGWREPLMVVGLFAVMELLANSYVEPVIYGKTTGVTALGLLVAAMFWTWLWGGLGLLLSTPMTVCLAVLGKYVPELRFFATLLGEDPPLAPDVRFYHRLLAVDNNSGQQIVESALETQSYPEVFDEILLPALARAEREHRRDAIDDEDRALIHHAIAEILDEIEEGLDSDFKSPSEVPAEDRVAPTWDENESAPVEILGLAADDAADTLVLRMLGMMLAPSGHSITILPDSKPTLQLSARIAELGPKVLIVSRISMTGSKTLRYLVWRLRGRLADLPIVVGRWSMVGDSAVMGQRFAKVGASAFVTRLSDARDAILSRLQPEAPEYLDKGVAKGATATSKP